MREILFQTKRNAKVYFKDKGLFFTSLITPAILLILFATFLANVYRDSFVYAFPAEFELSDKLIGGMVGGQIISSLLAVSCVTVAFCSNLVMISDKATGVRRDLLMSPVKSSVLAVSYYLASAVTTLIITLTAAGLCLVYLVAVGWLLSVADVFLLLSDVLLLTLFGVSLSSVINVFLSTNGQASAVGTIVSSCYGFICGAYMPLSSFPEWLQKIVMFLPGTYGTSLIRNHALAGVYRELESLGFGAEAIDGLKSSVDCNLNFFGNNVEIWAMYTVLALFTFACIVAYIVITAVKKDK